MRILAPEYKDDSRVLERRSVQFLEVKSIDDGNGYLEGYGSIKHVEDSYGDVILDGAYGDLTGFIKSGFSPYGHDWGSEPIGWIEDAKEDSKGLWVKIAFHGTKRAQECRQICSERLAAGKTVGLSIGFYTLDSERKDEKRFLKLMEIVECSPVNAPAAKTATAISVRSGASGSTPYEQRLTALLADAKDLVTRNQDIKALREADGKNFPSDDKRTELIQIKDGLSELITSLDDLIGEKSVPVPDEELKALSDELARQLG